MKFLRIFLVIFLLQTLCLLHAYAQSLEQNFTKANELYDRKEYEGAIVEYRKVVDLLKKGGNPSGAQKIQKTVGDLYYELSKFDQAVSEYNAALALNKTIDPELKAKLLIKLGNAHYKQGHFALASKTFEELLQPGAKITPEQRIDIICDLADTYRKNEIYSKAIKYYQEALKSSPIQSDQQRQSFILTATGLSLAKLGAFDEAILNLQKALELTAKLNNPQNTAEIYSNIGIVYWDRGDYPKALENIKKAQDIEQKNNLQKNLSADYDNEGLIYKSAGNLNKALEPLDQSIKLAQSIQYEQGGAIATANRAIVKKLQGNYSEAMKDFEIALEIYNKIKLQQGIGVCYQEIGNLYEIDKQDYKKAYEYYQKAFVIYNQLGLVSYQANVLNDLGSVLKKGINRQRTTRDLIFEDNAPVFIDMQPDEAKKKSIENYDKALALATKIGKKEDIWTAHQGLGYSLMQDGKQEEAFKHYKAAIDTVLSMKGGKSDSELMGNYMKNKEGLFTEAIELLTALFGKTKNIDYLKQQMEYQEIYKNEIMKNAMATANLNFQDPDKAKLSGSINESLSKKNKLEQLKAQYQNGGAAPKDASEAVQSKKDVEKELADIQTEITKIDGSFNDLLKTWKSNYPNDADMFDSAAKIDLTKIKEGLKDNESIIIYFPLDTTINIICITNKEIITANSNITYKELSQIIRNDFNAINIEKNTRKLIADPPITPAEQIKIQSSCNEILKNLYRLLIAPIEQAIANKTRLIIVANKMISYVPFAALIKGEDINENPHFLVYDKTISYMRLTNIEKINKKVSNINFSDYTILAIGNPINQHISTENKDINFGLSYLSGAEKEVDNINGIVVDQSKLKILKGKEATETEWKANINKTKYNIMYFATHGVPYAEIIYTQRNLAKRNLNIDPIYKRYYDYIDLEIIEKSHLNGYLLMADSANDNGMLTFKEILSLPESVFDNAKIAVLSACNSAVTFPSKIGQDLREELDPKKTGQELSDYGFIDGVDQVCLTDTFKKRNFEYVIGTLWFAFDDTTQFIMNSFFENLKKYDPPEALRKAQLSYLEKPNINFSAVPKHPFFWAIFAPHGR